MCILLCLVLHRQIIHVVSCRGSCIVLYYMGIPQYIHFFSVDEHWNFQLEATRDIDNLNILVQGS